MSETPGRLRWHGRWTGLAIALMTWILWMALRPDPKVVFGFPYGDKLLHAITFTCLMGAWGNIYPSTRGRFGCALLCLGFGILIEFAQWLCPLRDAEACDVLADSIGIVLALILLRTPLARVLRAIEACSGRAAD